MSDYLFLEKREKHLIIEYIFSYHLIYLCSGQNWTKAEGNSTGEMYIVWSVGERVNF